MLTRKDHEYRAACLQDSMDETRAALYFYQIGYPETARRFARQAEYSRCHAASHQINLKGERVRYLPR